MDRWKWGHRLGRAAARVLAGYGVHTIGNLARFDRESLGQILGKGGFTLHDYATGKEHAPVIPAREMPGPKSVGNGLTFPRNLVGWEELHTALKAFKDAKEGDEILVPAGASTFIPVKVTGNRKVIVGIGSNISVEKDVSDSVDYMDANSTEISEALKKSVEALNEAQNALTNITAAVQQEYSQRQQAASMQ